MAVVIQIDGYDPIGGLPITLRAGSVDDPRVCHLGEMLWWPAIAKLPTLRYDLFDGSFSAQITAPTSSLTLQTEQWPDFGRYALANARLRLWTGSTGADWAAYTLRFDGRITAQPKLAGGVASIDFAVDDSWLDAALLATYAGTTGVEGPAELKGQAKPLALGAPRYVAGKLIDSVNTVFQVSAYGAIGGVEAALEKLARFSPPVGDRPSYASLVAADIPAGRWATCRAAGLVRFGAPTEGLISFLVQGDIAGSDAWARRPGQLIRRLAILSGGAGRIDDASLNALDAVRPYDLSVYVEEQTTARDLIQRIAASVNAVAGVSWTGKLFVVPIGLAPASLTLSADGSTLPPVRSIEQIAIEAPWQKLAIGAERAWTVHGLADIAFTAPLVDVGAYDSATTYREGNIVSLPDGSRWLYVGTTPAAGFPPTAADPDRWSNLNPATKAGDITYDDGKTLEDLKPAEPGATNSADPNSPFGDGTVASVIATLDRVEPIAEATEVLKKARIDQDAILRQADRDRAALAAAQIAGLLDQNIQRVTLRDAGMITDPDTGRVYLYAVDQNEKRVSKVEIGLDAVSGQIALRATYNDVAVAIAQAQLSPGDAAEFGAIIARLNTVEVTLDSVNAALVLKADAITVTQLGGIVQSVSQTLDALAGTVATKVSYTDFNPVRDRVGTVEQTLLSFGDLSSYGITVRQAEVRGNAGTAAQLAGLLTSFETGQRQVVRAAEVQQQLYARLVDGDEAEAAARLLLGVRVGEAEGRIAQEQLIRASETSVLTQSVAGLTANFRDVSASVTQLSKAVSDGDNANAQLIAQVSARIGDFGIVSVQQAFAVLADRTGKLEGTVTVAIDTDGNLVGTKLIGSADGPGSLNLINANLRMGTGLVIYSAGTYERRGGAGFGSGRNLLEWFGPAAVPRGQETIANSRFATAADGKVYYGGADLDGGIGTSGKVKQLKLDGGVGGAGDGTAQLSVAAAVFPSGGKIKISGRLATASASNVDGGQPGENAGYWTIRFYANYGSGPQLIASAECSADVGVARVSDGVLALSGYLFDNPGPGGPVNLSAVVQRGGSPNSGIASQWTGSAIVEWVNA